MKKKKEKCEEGFKEMCKPGLNSSSSIYGVGIIGAAVFYIGEATTFWLGIVGFLKALVWPAFLVYHLLEFLVK